jgi:hypothetical protein
MMKKCSLLIDRKFNKLRNFLTAENTKEIFFNCEEHEGGATGCDT